MAKSNIVFSMILNNTDFVRNMNLSRGEVRRLENQVNKTTGSLSKMLKGGIAPMLGPLAGFAGGAALVGGALARSTEKMMELDTAMAEMKALLGATDEQMARFKDAAIGMASASTVAADEVIRSMIKVGGAMPQLLDFEDGLKAVTQSAITLSEASGMTLEDSINSLTSMMNQFGAAAMDSDRYINVLAAASQAGSAEIDYLSEAIAKAGGAATSADMEFEELVALIEAIAPKFGKAEEAGTALRGVLLKMETGGEKTKISTQGLAKALDNLSKMGTQEMLKKFGVEGYNMARAMVTAKDAFANFNTEIRGTDAAQEQAQIRADNLRSAIDLLVNKWDAFTLSVNNSSGPLTAFVNQVSTALDKMTQLNSTYNDFVDDKKGQNTDKAKKAAPALIDKYVSGGSSLKDATDQAIAEIEAELAKKQTKKSELAKKIAETEIPDVKDLSWTQKSQGLTASLLAHIVSGAQDVKGAVDPEGLRALREATLTESEKNDFDIDYLNKVLGFLKDKKTSLAGGKNVGGGGTDTGTTVTKDPLAAVRADLQAKGFDTKAIEEAMANADLLKQKISELDKAIAANANNPQVQQGLTQLRDNYKALLGEVEKAKTEPNKTVIAGLDVTQLDNTRTRVKELESQVKELEDLLQYDSGNTELVNKIKQLRAELNLLKPQIKEVTKNGYTNPWTQDYRDNWQHGNKYQRVGFASSAAGTVANGMSSAGNLVGRIPGLEEAGGAINEATGAIMDVISVIEAISAIMEMINGVSMAQEMVETTANTVALTANTAAIGVLSGSVVSLIGAIAANTTTNLIPGFSTGGIIGGNSWTGDKLMARVNSGEMILNAKQQRNLLSGLNTASRVDGGTVTTQGVLRGEDIYYSAKNYMLRTNKKW